MSTPVLKRAQVVPVSGGATSDVPEQLRDAVSIVVPTYNTGKVVRGVLEQLVHHTGGAVHDVLVIDNASNDGTPDVVRQAMLEDPELGRRVTLLENPENLGYGGSIKRGFATLAPTARWVAVMHSDEQCDSARTVLDMVQACGTRPQPDVVLASRFVDAADTKEYSLARRLGNHFFNTFTRLLSGLRMSDAGTGIMLIRADALRELPFEQLTSTYRFHPQLNVLLYSDPALVVAECPLSWKDARVAVPFSLVGYAVALMRMLLRFFVFRRVLRRPLAQSVIDADPGVGP